MKICNICCETKPIIDFAKDHRGKDGAQPYCKSCGATKSREYRKSNPDKIRERNQNWYSKNREIELQHKRELYRLDIDLSRKKGRESYQRNKARYIYEAKVRKRNLEQRTPSWASDTKIREIYEQCRKITEETGVQHHVDHVIPLNGKLVSGLHVETNLRIVTASENLNKSSKFIEELI